MNHDQSWQKLVTGARRAPESDVAVPFGFAARVAARGLAAARENRDWFGLFAFRALVVALAVMVTTAAATASWSEANGSTPEGENDPVTELVAAL